MRDVRYALLNANATTTGGVLIALNTFTIHHGVNVGVEGDHATCPACKVGGPVYNDCDPRYSLYGKQILVSGARVFCKCKEHPRVLPSQHIFSIDVDRSLEREEEAAVAATPNPGATHLAAEEPQQRNTCCGRAGRCIGVERGSMETTCGRNWRRSGRRGSSTVSWA